MWIRQHERLRFGAPLRATVADVRYDAHNAPLPRHFAAARERMADRPAVEVLLRRQSVDDGGFARQPVRILEQAARARMYPESLEVSGQHHRLHTGDVHTRVGSGKPERAAA